MMVKFCMLFNILLSDIAVYLNQQQGTLLFAMYANPSKLCTLSLGFWDIE